MKVTIFRLLSLALVFLAAEFFLRLSGLQQPGDLRPAWLRADALAESHEWLSDFVVNQDGILVANPDSLVIQGQRISKHGFPMVQSCKDTSAMKLMVVGDSFVWGYSATHPDSSFCRILSKSFQIGHYGIPAADPLQYSLICSLYLPEEKPDVLFLILFLGNDLLPYQAKRIDGIPFCAHSNKGFVYSAVDGIQFPDLDSAANYLFKRRYYLKKPEGIAENLVSHSSVLSLCWRLSWRIREKYVFEKERQNPSNTLQALRGASVAASRSDVRCMALLVPELKEAGLDTTQLSRRYQSLQSGLSLLGIETYWADYGPKAYRPYPDGHWNNQGHRMAAMHIRHILKRIEFRKD